MSSNHPEMAYVLRRPRTRIPHARAPAQFLYPTENDARDRIFEECCVCTQDLRFPHEQAFLRCEACLDIEVCWEGRRINLLPRYVGLSIEHDPGVTQLELFEPLEAT